MAKAKQAKRVDAPRTHEDFAAEVVTQLLDVRIELASTRAERHLKEGALPEHNRIDTAATGELDGNNLVVQVEFTFESAYEQDGSGKPAVVVGTTYDILFKLKSAEGLTAQHVASFSVLQGPFITWTYFREHLHGLLVKMGLPPAYLPPWSFNRELAATIPTTGTGGRKSRKLSEG